MQSLSNKRKLAISFSVIVFVVPLFFSNTIIPDWIERYESGAPIGVEIDVFTETPVADLTVKQKSESGSEIIGKGQVFVEKKYTFTPETLPDGWDFHLALTDKYYDGVEFRAIVDKVLGAGNAVQVFEEMQFFIPIIGGIFSVIQGIFTASRDERKPGFWFYEYTYIKIIHIRKIIIIQSK